MLIVMLMKKSAEATELMNAAEKGKVKNTKGQLSPFCIVLLCLGTKGASHIQSGSFYMMLRQSGQFLVETLHSADSKFLEN